MEGWKDGRMEGWKDGRMEGWKDGRMEGWKDQPHQRQYFRVPPRPLREAGVRRSRFPPPIRKQRKKWDGTESVPP